MATHTGFVIVSFVLYLVLVPTLAGRGGEVVVNFRGLIRHVGGEAFLFFLPAFRFQVLPVKGFAVLLYLIRVVLTKSFPANFTESLESCLWCSQGIPLVPGIVLALQFSSFLPW